MNEGKTTGPFSPPNPLSPHVRSAHSLPSRVTFLHQMERKSSSLNLENALSRLLSLELLRRAVRSDGRIDTGRVMQELESSSVLPSDICARLASELADLIAFRREDALVTSDRHAGKGWSEKVIRQRMMHALKLEIAELMTNLRDVCDGMEETS